MQFGNDFCHGIPKTWLGFQPAGCAAAGALVREDQTRVLALPEARISAANRHQPVGHQSPEPSISGDADFTPAER